MPKSKRTKAFAAVKRMISPNDPRLAPVKAKLALAAAEAAAPVRNVAPIPAAMYLSHNTALGPPYHILLDTNFINFAIKNKLEIVRAAMDCLLAKCVPVVTDCVIAELEKLGVKYRVALRVAKDPRFERLTCSHKGTYADDCIVNRVTEHRCYIVGTCDKGAARRFSTARRGPAPCARARARASHVYIAHAHALTALTLTTRPCVQTCGAACAKSRACPACTSRSASSRWSGCPCVARTEPARASPKAVFWERAALTHPPRARTHRVPAGGLWRAALGSRE